jgi:hypothetical protein
MDILEIYIKQHKLAKEEFPHLIEGGEILRTPGGLPQKLRLTIIDGSLIDIFLSSSDRYSCHWERRHLDGTLYRHDNAQIRNSLRVAKSRILAAAGLLVALAVLARAPLLRAMGSFLIVEDPLEKAAAIDR